MNDMRKLLQVVNSLYESKSEVAEKGNPFHVARREAIRAGEEKFTVNGKTYPVTDADPAEVKDIMDETFTENVSEKSKSIIDGWISSEGHRGAAAKLVDHMLNSMADLSSSDLSDTVTFADGLDEIEELLSDQDYRQALKVALETAKEMLQDEGFPGMFEGKQRQLDLSESEITVSPVNNNIFEIKTPYGDFHITDLVDEGGFRVDGELYDNYFEDFTAGESHDINVSVSFVIDSDEDSWTGTYLQDVEIIPDEHGMDEIVKQLAEHDIENDYPDLDPDSDEYQDVLDKYYEHYHDNTEFDEDRVMNEVIEPLADLIVEELGTSFDELEAKRSGTKNSLLGISEQDEEQGGYDIFMSAEEAEEIVRDYADMHGDSFQDGLESMRMQYEHDGDLDRNERVAYEIYTGKIKPFDMDKLIGEDQDHSQDIDEVANAIFRRLRMAHHDAIKGIPASRIQDSVHSVAADYVADGISELGTSDVRALTQHVLSELGVKKSMKENISDMHNHTDMHDGEYVVKQVIGHEDHETRMMQRELLKIQDYCGDLINMLDEHPNGDYPHWWQAKLVKAGDYISTIKHFLDGEKRLGPRKQQPMVHDEIPAISVMPVADEIASVDYRDFDDTL